MSAEAIEKAKAATDAAVAQGVHFAEAEEARLNAERKAHQAAERKAEAERKAKAEAARQAVDAEAARLLAEAQAKAAANTASSFQAQRIFIQLPGLDALSAKVDAAIAANVKLIHSERGSNVH